MRLTKFGHACVRLEGPGGTLVIDPGALTEDGAVDDVDAVLITHEHFDHFVEGRIRAAARRNPALEIWTVPAVAEMLTGIRARLHTVGHGDTFTTAGFEVEAYGSLHAPVHPDVPVVANTGFLIDRRLFHPGDALTVPGRPVATLLLPVHAPWSRMSDLIDWVRRVSPVRTLAVHDGELNPTGVAMVGGFLGEHGPGIGARYRRLAPRECTADV
jgi:L-ascorbate metabolism protein UlaG (beta-lactamase superfamily)